MSIEDEGSDDDADDKVGLGIASEKGNQNGNGCCARERPERDVPPFPYDSGKDQEFNQDGNGRYHQINAQGRGDPFPPFKPKKDREDVAEKRG